MWGILNTLSSSEVEEVTIDSAANWKSAKTLASGIKVSLAHFVSIYYLIREILLLDGK